MKKIFLIISFLIYQNLTLANLFYEDDKVLDLSKLYIIRDKHDKHPLVDERETTTITDIMARLKEQADPNTAQGKARLNKVVVINLSQNCLKSEVFNELISQLDFEGYVSNFINLGLVNLCFNTKLDNKTGEGIVSLIDIVQQAKNSKINLVDDARAKRYEENKNHIKPFINLIGTLIDNKEIVNLLHYINDLNKDPTIYSDHLIFLKKAYLNDAFNSKKALYYNNLIKEHLLTPRSKRIHTLFFKSREIKILLRGVENKKTNQLLDSIKKSGKTEEEAKSILRFMKNTRLGDLTINEE